MLLTRYSDLIMAAFAIDGATMNWFPSLSVARVLPSSEVTVPNGKLAFPCREELNNEKEFGDMI